MSFEIGSTVGAYRIIGIIGSGATAEVYKAEHTITRRVDAMKVVAHDPSNAAGDDQRFLREIQVQARLDHPNIAAVHNAFREEGHLVMIMELIEGRSLRKTLEAGTLPLPVALDYACQALAALEYAHAHGVIHRDISPANMVVTENGTLKLTDFGLAKSLTDVRLTQTGSLLGSLYYASPEQIKGSEAIDARSDVYSLGVVLYEMVTGVKPFRNDNLFHLMLAHVEQAPEPPASINPALPRVLDESLLKALDKDPDRRFQSAGLFRGALEAARAEWSESSQEARAPELAREETIPPAAPMAVESGKPAVGQSVAAVEEAGASEEGPLVVVPEAAFEQGTPVVVQDAAAEQKMAPAEPETAAHAAGWPKTRTFWQPRLIKFAALAASLLVLSPFWKRASSLQPEPARPAKAAAIEPEPDYRALPIDWPANLMLLPVLDHRPPAQQPPLPAKPKTPSVAMQPAHTARHRSRPLQARGAVHPRQDLVFTQVESQRIEEMAKPEPAALPINPAPPPAVPVAAAEPQTEVKPPQAAAASTQPQEQSSPAADSPQVTPAKKTRGRFWRAMNRVVHSVRRDGGPDQQ